MSSTVLVGMAIKIPWFGNFACVFATALQLPLFASLTLLVKLLASAYCCYMSQMWTFKIDGLYWNMKHSRKIVSWNCFPQWSDNRWLNIFRKESYFLPAIVSYKYAAIYFKMRAVVKHQHFLVPWMIIWRSTATDFWRNSVWLIAKLSRVSALFPTLFRAIFHSLTYPVLKIELITSWPSLETEQWCPFKTRQ